MSSICSVKVFVVLFKHGSRLWISSFVMFSSVRVKEVFESLFIGTLVTDLACSGVHVYMLSCTEQTNQIKG